MRSNVIIAKNNSLEVYMINPVIFTIGGLSLRWYGVIVMLGVIVGSLMVERVLKQHGENSDTIWDALVWVLPIGIIGARLWYVVNATLGGNTLYIKTPSEILMVWHGGLHIFGGLLLGGIALLYYLNKNKLDVWLFLDAAGPAMLVGQAIGRIANFINQELYGPPTKLPWGIPISAEHRLPQFANLPDTTRFHPTFAYEMIWNLASAGVLLWLSKRYEKQIKPGTLFAGWLIAAGVGRTWIELFFRPDQPKIGNSIVSYSAVVSALMAIFGAILLMARYKAIQLQATENWEDEYKISTRPVQLQPEPVEIVEAPRAPRVKRVAKATTKSVAAKRTTTSKAVEKSPAPKKKPTTRAKKPASE
jgi:phosphatidylglycerol---prolipoprotein diacylglyceryl transferase